MQNLILPLGILALLAACITMLVFAFRGLWRSWFPDDSNDVEYLEHYTTDGRLREEAFPPPEDPKSEEK